MQIMLLPAAASEQQAFADLVRLYHDDLKRVDDGLQSRPCCSHSQFDAFWGCSGSQPFSIQVDGQLAGFALVNRRSKLHSSYDGHTVSDFFVLQRFRRQGIGRAAAITLFERLPGRWEVASCARNVPGHVFWRGVVDRYTCGRYDETWVQTASWCGPVQSFTTSNGCGSPT